MNRKYCWFCRRYANPIRAIRIGCSCLFICLKCAVKLHEELEDWLRAVRYAKILREWVRLEEAKKG